jgi:hypothetical protein
VKLRATGRIAGGAASAALAIAAIAPQAIGHVAYAAQVCTGVNAPTVQSATQDTSLANTFINYGNTTSTGWTGADSTYSAVLPNGTDAWAFSDTFLPPVNSNGSRPSTAPLINNSFVLMQNGQITATVQRGTLSNPEAPMPPIGNVNQVGGKWFWARDPMLHGSTLQVPYAEYERTGTGQFDFQFFANVLGLYSTGNPTQGLQQPFETDSLPSSAGITWDAWEMTVGSFTYVYGVEDTGANKYLHIARVSGTDLRGAWQFYDGNGNWLSTESSSARLLTGVSDEFSVSLLDNKVYMLLTHDTTQAFSSQIEAYFSCFPNGPFVDETPVYLTPITNPNGVPYNNSNIYTYNSHVHPELAAQQNGQVVLSYNMNSLVNQDVLNDVSIYRPRFVSVQFSS